MKKLIAYYSRAGENYFSGTHRAIAVGNTEKAARLLAELTGAELFHIEQKVPYSDDYDTCVAEARRDLRANARPELTALPERLDDYDEIYLGYPKAIRTTAVPCRWRSTPSLSTMIGRGKPSIRSARTRAAACRTRSRTSGGLQRARGSRPVCPCAAARWTAQNRNWSSGCAGNVCVLTGREEGGCA